MLVFLLMLASLNLETIPTLPPADSLSGEGEIRIVSVDLKKVIGAFSVENRKLKTLRRVEDWPADIEVLVILRFGELTYVFPGITTANDVILILDQETLSLREVFRRYKLYWPGPDYNDQEVPLGPHPDRRR